MLYGLLLVPEGVTEGGLIVSKITVPASRLKEFDRPTELPYPGLT